MTNLSDGGKSGPSDGRLPPEGMTTIDMSGNCSDSSDSIPGTPPFRPPPPPNHATRPHTNARRPLTRLMTNVPGGKLLLVNYF